MDQKRAAIYRFLIEQMENLPLHDYAATCSLQKNINFCSKNVRELLQSRDKTMNFHLLDCDEKYKNGTASDYEVFAEWERIMPLCAGTGTAVLYAEEKRILGIDTTATPQEAWRTVLEWSDCSDDSFLPHITSDQTVDFTRFLSGFLIKNKGKPFAYAEILNEILIKVKQQKTRQDKDLHLILTCDFDSFEALNRYRAEQLFKTNKRVENYNKNEKFLVSAQLFIDLILAARQESIEPILHLRRRSDVENIQEFLDYLAAHRLLAGELRIGFSLDTDSKHLTVLCESLCENIPVHPELILSPSDFGTDIAQRLRSFASVYPVGGLRFGGIDTDAPLFWAGHRLFKEHLARLLSELCETEEQAIRLAECICEQ